MINIGVMQIASFQKWIHSNTNPS